MHEEICAISDKYKESCTAIHNYTTSYRNNIDVNIKCTHFVVKPQAKGNADLPQNKGGANNDQ